MAPGSEPWSGSVRPKQPMAAPLASGGRYFWRWASGPNLLVGTPTPPPFTPAPQPEPPTTTPHPQRALHAGHRAVARIDALALAGDQAVGHVTEARAAVLLRDGGAQQAHGAHFAEDAGVHFFMAKSL